MFVNTTSHRTQRARNSLDWVGSQRPCRWGSRTSAVCDRRHQSNSSGSGSRRGSGGDTAHRDGRGTGGCWGASFCGGCCSPRCIRDASTSTRDTPRFDSRPCCHHYTLSSQSSLADGASTARPKSRDLLDTCLLKAESSHAHSATASVGNHPCWRKWQQSFDVARGTVQCLCVSVTRHKKVVSTFSLFFR